MSLPTIEVQGAGDGTGGAGGPAAETARGPVNGLVASRSATGTKTDSALIETPQSISVVPSQQIEDQAAQSVSQALRYTPGVVSESRPGRYDSVFVRGFGGGGTAANYVNYLDGLKLQRAINYGVPSVEPYGLSRIEVLRGPASVLYGQGNPAGIINLISKKPTPEPFGEVLLRVGSYGEKQAAFDIGGPVNADRTLMYRVTGLTRGGDTQVQYTRDERVYIAPAFTWKPDDATTLTVLAKYQNDPETGFYGFMPAVGTVLPNKNGRIPTKFFPGDPIFEGFSRKEAMIGYEFEHHFNEVFTVRQNVRFMDLDSYFKTIAGAALTMPGQSIITRRATYSREHLAAFNADTQVEARFNTGALRHKMLLGLDYQYGDSSAWTGFGGTVSPINWLAPVYYQPFTPASAGYIDQIASQAGVYLQDQVKWDRFVLLAGVRTDWAKADIVTRATGASTKLNDRAVTGRAALLYLFDNGVAPYASYSTSFDPVTTLGFGGTPFEPTTGEQYEAGVKYQPPGMNAFIQMSAYQLTQQNVLTADPTNIGFFVQTGEVRARGIEIEGRATLMEGLDLIAGYSYIDARVTKSNVAAEVGQPPVAAPRQTASVWAQYTFQGGPLLGLSIGGGVRYVGESNGDATGFFTVPTVGRIPARIPAYGLVDAVISYDFAAVNPRLKGMKLQVNAQNLLDNQYVSSCFSQSCNYGLRRTVLATLSYRW
ncbi:TonB-dependent siderophore receptor [Chelatococcus reniformis]|uniref:TonB-dependent siderophore receptor n=1 Tax=Chelatococcus reniformis TaxID=1494448 RepID=UPI00166B650B|nr:TonB-dependent siderophore receptor [Chelatococcus reniformis]